MADEAIKILIIEDSITEAYMLSSTLKKNGFDIASSQSLEGGLEILANGQIDLTLLDLSLPDSTGIDSLVKVHAHSPAVPIIVLTGLEDEAVASQALKEGAQDYLIKGQGDTQLLLRSIRYGIERGRAQSALREIEQRFHVLVNGITDYAIFMVDSEGHIVTWNLGAERITGYSEQEAIGKPISIFYPPDEIERGLPELSLKLASEQGRVEDECWRLRKDGSLFWSNVVTTALRDEAGRLRGFSRVARDMTEYKRLERILREKEVMDQKNLLVELLQSVTVSINKAKTIEEALKTCLEQVCTRTKWDLACALNVVAGQTSGLEVKKIWFVEELSLSKLMGNAPESEIVTPAIGLAGEALDRGRPVWSNKVQEDPTLLSDKLITESGARCGFALPVFEGENVTAILEFFSYDLQEPDQPFLELMTNVSRQLEVVIERKRLEEELIRQANELARSNAELQEFAKIAAHDLQEPLRAVQGFVGLLTSRYKSKLDDDAERFFQFIEDAIQRMIKLIKGVLEHSKIGTQAKPKELVDCNAVLEEVKANLAFAIEESHAKISSEALPKVMAHRYLLVQLFQNLISNAIKYRGTSQPIIHVFVEKQGNEWIFSIQDNGIGLEQKYANQIFGMFNRLHGKTEYAGTGIGLAICKKIVEYHGGRIWVKSQPGSGSTFFFSFPASS